MIKILLPGLSLIFGCFLGLGINDIVSSQQFIPAVDQLRDNDKEYGNEIPLRPDKIYVVIKDPSFVSTHSSYRILERPLPNEMSQLIINGLLEKK